MKRSGAVVAMLLSGWLTLGTAATACGFHGYAPEATIVDRLLSSEHVVLARSGETDPFRFAAVSALVGPVEHVSVPHLVDTTTRRRLSARPEDAVLFARDGAYGPWERLAYVDAGMRPVLDEIMARIPAWQMGGDLDRAQFFADLLDHPQPEIQRLALRELDRVAYPVLREITLQLPADLARRHVTPGDVSLTPILVLLQGLVGDPAALPDLERGFSRSLRAQSPWLGAYAVAMVEIDPAQGIARLATALDAPEHSAATRERLVEALALQAEVASAEVRAQILTALDLALQTRPELAAPVARQFAMRYDWALAAQAQAAQARAGLTSPADLIAVAQYAALAREFETDAQK